MTTIHDTIFKVDSKGKVRVWYIEQDEDKYRTWDGTQLGKIKASEWRVALPTNNGRSNERLGDAQALFEIEAIYKKKLEKDYHTNINNILSGAHIFEAMLAEKYQVFAAGYGQPKLDGFRCIATKDGLSSRRGKPFVSSPHIMEALAPLFKAKPDLILDGELYNHDLRDNFDEIQSLITVKSDKKLTSEHYEKTREMVQYHVYDMPSHKGVFNDRHNVLLNLIESINGCMAKQTVVQVVETCKVESAEQFDILHGKWLQGGYEGSMWRNNTPYENRRTKNLLKRKDFVDEEFEVVSLEEGQGNWSGTCKSVSCKTKEGKSFSAGIKGSKEITDVLFARKDTPPKFVTIQFQNYTPDGIPRFPIAIKFWDTEKD
jgi:DNA ligase-1